MFEEVERTCDRIGIIRNGKLLTIDSIETLRARHMHTYTVRLNSEKLAKDFAKDFDGVCNGNLVTVEAKQNLETIFLNYYGGEEKCLISFYINKR